MHRPDRAHHAERQTSLIQLHKARRQTLRLSGLREHFAQMRLDQHA
jgi:hypothetical protein